MESSLTHVPRVEQSLLQALGQFFRYLITGKHVY
jgi:hypothetical protein